MMGTMRMLGKKANIAVVLQHPIWKSNVISSCNQLKIINSNVKSVVFYGCETLNASKTIQNKSKTFVHGCLRRTLRIRRSDRVSDLDLW